MRLALALALALAIAATGAALPGLTPAQRAAILTAPASTTLQVRDRDLPPAVRAEVDPIADPGQPFQVTDVIMPGDNLPSRRLVWGARIGRLYVMQHEFGGIAEGFQVDVFDLSGPKARTLWTGGPPNIRYPNLAAFQRAVRSGQVKLKQ